MADPLDEYVEGTSHEIYSHLPRCIDKALRNDYIFISGNKPEEKERA